MPSNISFLCEGRKMQKNVFMRIVLFLLIAFTTLQNAYPQKGKEKEKPVDIMSFTNSAHHWYDVWAPDNVIEPLKDKPRYKQEEMIKIADNILLFQKNNGGWPKNYDMLAILNDEQKEKVIKSKNMLNTTFDNWTTHSHIEYLAKVYTRTKIKKYKDACLKGIDYVLSAQYPNGGWPQFFPDTSGYAKYITYNDGVMTGIMRILYDILERREHFLFVGNDYIKKIKKTFNLGMECILKCQIMDNGKLTVWGQQHDNVTLKPQWARTFEPPSICNGESSDLILFLMTICNPSKEIINSIQCAVQWIEDSKIKGIRIETKSVPPVKYQYSTVAHDRYIVEDSSALPIWARYYELGTHRPLFCNRDSKVVYSLAEVLHERRASYGWYTYEPQMVLDAYPEWQKKWASGKNIIN